MEIKTVFDYFRIFYSEKKNETDETLYGQNYDESKNIHQENDVLNR